MITRNPQNAVVSTLMAKLLLTSLTLLLTILVGESRELRPSEHGLPYQNLPVKSPDMMMFFGDQASPPEKKPPSPEILDNSNKTASLDTWWRETSPEKRKENRVRKALLIATVVCGGTGVILLLAAAFLFAVHFYRQRLETPSGLAIVVADNNNVNQSASVSGNDTGENVPNSK